MKEDNAAFAINLVEDPTFTTRVPCKLPGAGADTWRPFEFKATFRVLSEAEQDEQPMNITVRDLLRKVLVSVDGVPSATVDGVELSPVEVVIHNQFTSDAALTVYRLRTTQNSRDLNSSEAMKSATSRGNSPRSQRR